MAAPRAIGQPRAMEELLDAHTALRLATLSRHASFRGPGAHAFLRERIAPLHREGSVQHAEHEGRLAGVLAWRHDPDHPQFGVPVSSVAIAYDAGWPGAERWLGEVLDRELPRMEADLDCMVDIHQPEAYRALAARGVGIDSIMLLGDPRAALARLLRDREVPPLPAPLAIVPLERAHVDEAVALFRAAFTAEPQYCWFGGNEQHLSRQREELEKELAEGTRGHRVMVDGSRVVGALGASVREDGLFGRTAGMSLVLAPELRGRGLLRPIYRHLLEHMIAEGAVTFRGGTSQPPVMRLGRVLGRPCVGAHMRRRNHFPASHFAQYLPW